MNKHFIILVLIFVSVILRGQIKADSLLIYNDFKGRGTTANLWHYHHDADSLKISLTKLSDNDLNVIKNILADSKQKKHFQQKHGGQLLLGFVYLNGQKFKCAISNHPNYIQFVNLSSRKQIFIQNTIKSLQINTILNKYSK